MEQAISINTMDEYIGALCTHFDFTMTEEADALTLRVPEKLGTGYIRVQDVSDAISIGVMDLSLKAPLVCHYDSYDNTCELTYCLSGHISYVETGVPKARLGKDEVGVYAIPRTRGMMMIPSGERVLAVAVASMRAFQEQLPYAEECEKFEDQGVRGLLCSLAKPNKLNARLHNHFHRILENEMSGSMRNTYLDSLGKMMLTEVWQESIVAPLSGKERLPMEPFEQNALMNAKAILNQQYLRPPSTQALAKRVALNEYRLKTGFRELFGKSIYEYARSIRMEDARHLMEDRTLSVGQIASMVGYVNTSHFARAFRSAYGMNPSDFRSGS